VRTGDRLVCEAKHEYPCVDDIPIMLPNQVGRECDAWLDKFKQPPSNRQSCASDDIDPFVQANIAATNGVMYRPLVGKLTRYPIPSFPMKPRRGTRLLDVGCNWGRWCIAAARSGYQAVGIDPSFEAICAARRVARQLGVNATYVVADARQMPLADDSFDAVFSYSVLQHLEKSDARRAFAEVGRVLKADGESLIQLPNIFGVRSLQNRARRMFRERSPFDVNYYTPGELEALFRSVIGPTIVSVDGYFCLNPQPTDLDLLRLPYRAVVRVSATLHQLSVRLRWMRYFADSLYVHSTHQ